MHEEREAIDRALVEGKPYRDIARRHATSKDALMRHHHAHVSPALTRVVQRREERGAETALNRLEDLYERAKRVLDETDSAGLQLGAIRELRAIVEALAKITGELRPESSAVTVNILQSPEIQRYIVVIREVLADQPDRLALIAQRLELPA